MQQFYFRLIKMCNKDLSEKWWYELKYADYYNGFGNHIFKPENKEFGEV